MAAPEPRTLRTQVQRRADSHALILDAAVRCLVEMGYHDTTTVAIQARAGVSRGRLLHHFPSRDALLIAATHHLVADHAAELETWLAHSLDGRLTGAERSDRATELLWETFQRPYFWAVMELWIAARTDEVLRTELAAAERRLRTALEDVVVAIYGEELAARPAFPEVRRLLFTSMRGVALTYALERRDPATDPHLPIWKRVARLMLLGED